MIEPSAPAVVPEPAREHLDAALVAAAGDDRLDAGGAHRAAA
jgi:hypothetical protein